MEQSATPPGRRRHVRLLTLWALSVLMTIVALVGWGLSRSEPTPWGEVRVEGRVLVVDYLGGECDRSASLDVVESADQVELTVRISGWSLACSDVAVPRQVRATLKEPLGRRELVDGACRTGKYSQQPACQEK